jgi:hypothetical protein
MNNPDTYLLGDVALAAINAATTATVVTASNDSSGNALAYIGELDGLTSAGIGINFNWGSGGTSIKVIIETSDNDGSTWTEVYRAALTTASAERKVNLSALTPVTSPYTPTTLSDDTTKDGILGPRWRARILTVGVYAGNTSLAIRLTAR